jgi:transposase
LGLDRTRWPELLVGFEAVRVLEVARSGDGRLHVAVETTDDHAGCPDCGVRAEVKDRDRVELVDLPAFGSAVRMVWVKRRWCCVEPLCGRGSWTERNDSIAAARCALTRRAGLWATEQVGRLARPVSQVAAELGVAWHTVMDAVELYGTPLIEDPDRVEGVSAIGVDETKWLAAQATEPTRWVSAVVDVEGRKVIDLLAGRNAADLTGWLAARDADWRAGITTAVCDLHEPFRAAFDAQLPHATQVADPFHVVAAGTRVIDRTRRRVQNATLGHRGRKHDPLYRARKLLTMADERLDDHGRHKLRGLLAAGDPRGEVAAAHNAKECLRDLYTLWGQPDVAARWLSALTADLARHTTPELRGMAHTLGRWRTQILAWHVTGVSNGPTEGLNALIKKVKRIAAGFRNFAHYRLRVLLHTGGCNWHLLGATPR